MLTLVPAEKSEWTVSRREKDGARGPDFSWVTQPCNYQQTFQHWRSAPADCCGRLCRTKSHRRQDAADIEVVRRVLDTAVDCGCVLSAGLAAAGRAEYKGGCVAAGGCTRVHEEFRGQCFVFLLVFC